MHTVKDTSNLISQGFFSCRRGVFLAWVFGVIAGIWYGSFMGSGFVSLMRSAVTQPVSIVGILAVDCLPFLLTAFAVMISRRELLIPLAFAKAFSFSACACLVEFSFGSSGWLIRLLLLFSQWITAPLLLWLWLELTDENLEKPMRELFVCGVLIALTAAADFCYVSPFLALLFEL